MYPYGLIGNCETAALVSTSGAIDWFCYPRFDSPSIFAAILDRQRGGSFRISPVNPVPVGEQAYLHDTNLLTTTFHRPEGTLVVTDSASTDTGFINGLSLHFNYQYKVKPKKKK